MQQAPWQRAIFVTYAEEAPERHYRISDLPAPLVDHYALDRPQLFSVAATNRCAFDLVARDQIGGFACLHCRSNGSCHGHLLPTAYAAETVEKGAGSGIPYNSLQSAARELPWLLGSRSP